MEGTCSPEHACNPGYEESRMHCPLPRVVGTHIRQLLPLMVVWLVSVCGQHLPIRSFARPRHQCHYDWQVVHRGACLVRFYRKQFTLATETTNSWTLATEAAAKASIAPTNITASLTIDTQQGYGRWLGNSSSSRPSAVLVKDPLPI
jgi:hypothetical protein